MTYGVPYQGSKNRIVKDIIKNLPSGKRFVDLFAGGCAMTHFALLSGKYEKVLCNDLYPYGSNLFKNALNGEYSKQEYLRWISHEEFDENKDTDDFVKMCYSFSNNGQNYMYSEKIEPLKKGLHFVVIFDDWTYLEQYAKDNNWRDGLIDILKKSIDGITSLNERRLRLTKPAYDNDIIGLPHNMVQSLERINRLQNIERINRLENIGFTASDYRDYQHEEGDVVYADPPYQGVWNYNETDFDHDAFWEWVRTRDYPVYVSEYKAPGDFTSIWEKGIPKRGCGGKSSNSKAIEHLFIHNKFLKR